MFSNLFNESDFFLHFPILLPSSPPPPKGSHRIREACRRRVALLRATRLARDRQLDLDARRAEHPTRQRGLSGRWVQGGAAPAPQRVDDAYNLYVDYKRSDAAREAHQHGERAPVPEFDTLYRAALAVRLAGLLLADPLLSPAPLACPALFDPAAAPAFDPAEGPPMTLRLLYPHRDPYWPTYGHPADEF